MGLNDLPPELIAHIVSHLVQLETITHEFHAPDERHISSHACIFEKFQHAIEHHTYSSLTFTSDDLPEFEQYVAHPRSRRASILKWCDFRPVLPAYDDKACAQYETPAEQAKNNHAYSFAVKRLFRALRICEEERTTPLVLNLSHCHSPTDGFFRGKEKFTADRNAAEMGMRNDLFEKRYKHSQIRADFSDGIETLDHVFDFDVQGDCPRYVAPSSIVPLLRKLPNLDTVTLHLDDMDRKYPEVRAQLRADFAQSLEGDACGHLTSFTLAYRDEPPVDHRFEGADLRGSSATSSHDILSTALNRFLIRCPILVGVDLGGLWHAPICIDESIFWPSGAPYAQQDWAQLQRFTVEMSPERPDGGWYLSEHPEFARDEPDTQELGVTSEDEETSSESSSDYSDNSFFAQDERPPVEYNHHREKLRTGDAYALCYRCQSTEELDRVFEAAARAATFMPKLRFLEIRMKVEPCPRTDYEAQKFGFYYGLEGEFDVETQSDLTSTRLHWDAPREWKMGESLEALWRKILGPEGQIIYDEW